MFGMGHCLVLCRGVIICCITLNLNHAFNNLSRIGQCASDLANKAYLRRETQSDKRTIRC